MQELTLENLKRIRLVGGIRAMGIAATEFLIFLSFKEFLIFSGV